MCSADTLQLQEDDRVTGRYFLYRAKPLHIGPIQASKRLRAVIFVRSVLDAFVSLVRAYHRSVSTTTKRWMHIEPMPCSCKQYFGRTEQHVGPAFILQSLKKARQTQQRVHHAYAQGFCILVSTRQKHLAVGTALAAERQHRLICQMEYVLVARQSICQSTRRELPPSFLLRICTYLCFQELAMCVVRVRTLLLYSWTC